MKTFDHLADDDEPGIRSIDWKALPSAMLKAIDEQLEEHGLEVHWWEAGDAYTWAIRPRT
jgi:hypothetical protein